MNHSPLNHLKTNQPFSNPLPFKHLRIPTLIACMCLALSAQAESKRVEKIQAVEIKSEPLDKALNSLAKQTGLQILFASEVAANQKSNALKGNLSAKQALTQMLQGTNLVAKEQADGTFIIVKAQELKSDADTLPEVAVRAGKASPSALSKPFAGGQVAKSSRVGILGNVDIFDTPFSTQSFTDQFALDQQARRVADIIEVDPSVRNAMAEYGDSETYMIRGFPLFVNQVGINGLYGMTEQRRIAPEFYERVDVLKAPASTLNGSSPFGVTGGNINLVTKRAADQPLNRITGSYISESQHGGHADFGRRFGEDNAWGVRLNLLARDGETPINRQEDRMYNGALAVDYRAEKLTASLDMMSQDRLTKAYSANITYNQGFALPRAPENDKNFVNDWEFFKGNSNNWIAKAEYEFSPEISAYAAYGQAKGQEEYFYAGTQGRRFINSAGDFTARVGGFKGLYEVETYELGLRGRIDAWQY